MPDIFAPTTVFTSAGPLVQFVLLVLLGFSALTWVIIFERWLHLGGRTRGNAAFTEAFWSGGNLVQLYQEVLDEPQEGMTPLFVSAMREYLRLNGVKAERTQVLEGIQRVLRVALIREERELSRRLPVLAVIASTSPYIGLFGTVWGIIDSFRGISGAAQATLTALAPGIAEALVATALGLFAAIPATIAHNALGALASRHGGEMEDFAEDVLAVMERQLSAPEKE